MKIPWNCPKKVVQLPEKTPGEIIPVEVPEKNGNLGVTLCNGCPLYMLCGLAHGKEQNSYRDTRHRQGADRADRQSARQPLRVFEEVAVWRCECFVFLVWWSADLKLHDLPSDGIHSAPQRTGSTSSVTPPDNRMLSVSLRHRCWL